MFRPNVFSVGLLALATVALVPLGTSAADLRLSQNALEARYTRAHSLGDTYQFYPRDGWQTVNVSNLQYKYRREDTFNLDFEGDPDDSNGLDGPEDLTKRDSKNSKSHSKVKTTSHAKSTSKSQSKAKATANVKATPNSKSKTDAKSVTKSVSSLQKVIDTIKGVGKAEPVLITWYTGHDLLNPSCWPNPTWAPTDASFAAALTLEGWTTKPKCFKFLELCNTPKKCVFVRVVDSCAGCATGSKHVDLTQAAFKELADLGTGIMSVQMRQATDPDGWLESLWGPKH